MVTISTTSGAVTVTFSDNGHYLDNGTISFPLNSLVLVTDDSSMATFKNVAEDLVFGATYDELGMTKDELIDLYESSFVGSTGGGVSPEDVAEMIDEAVSGKANTNDVNEALEVAARALFELKETKQEASAMTSYATTATTAALNTAITAHTSDATIHVTSTDKTNWDGAVTALGGNKIVALTQAQYDALQTKDATTLYIITA